MRTLSFKEVKKAIEEGLSLEMCKYKYFGIYTPWKAVSSEVAQHKMNVKVLDYEGGHFCPYVFRLAE